VKEPDTTQSNTIDEVIERLDQIIGWTEAEGSRIGYFAALYRGVTDGVREGIATGRFQDRARMERFIVAFANRYVDALRVYRTGQRPSRAWSFAFESARGTRPVILQHLLLGINAHINLDLGVAAAEVSKDGELDDLRQDFLTVNDILSSRMNVVRAQIARVSPLIHLLGQIDPTADRAVINFSIERARDQAWTVAELLACLHQDAWPDRIDVLDRSTTALGRLVRDPPGRVLSSGLGLIRLSETRSVGSVIRALQDMVAEGT
jgi:Family of unknown function (DUF5995)